MQRIQFETGNCAAWCPVQESKVWFQQMRVMKTFEFVVEQDSDTGLYVGYVPGWPGAHSQGASMDEVERNLREVVAMLLEDGEPKLESQFIGVRTVQVA